MCCCTIPVIVYVVCVPPSMCCIRVACGPVVAAVPDQGDVRNVEMSWLW